MQPAANASSRRSSAPTPTNRPNLKSLHLSLMPAWLPSSAGFLVPMTATPEIHLTFSKTPRNRKGEFNALYTVTDAIGRNLRPSRTPLLSAARVLLQAGHDPTSNVFMTRAGEAAWSLKAPLGVAAKLTVRENETVGPVFAPYDDEKLALLRKTKASS